MKTDDLNAGLTGLTGELQADQGGKVIAGITDGKAGDNNLTAKSGSDKDTAAPSTLPSAIPSRLTSRSPALTV